MENEPVFQVGDVVKLDPSQPILEPGSVFYSMNTGRYVIYKLTETIVWIKNLDGSAFPDAMRDNRDKANYKSSKIMWFHTNRLVKDHFLTAARKAIHEAK